jgi:hypothetical protein
MRRVTITQASDYDLVGDLVELTPSADDSAARARKRRVSLKVLASSSPPPRAQ